MPENDQTRAWLFKLMTSLVNISLNFQTLVSQIHNFFVTGQYKMAIDNSQELLNEFGPKVCHENSFHKWLPLPLLKIVKNMKQTISHKLLNEFCQNMLY